MSCEQEMCNPPCTNGVAVAISNLLLSLESDVKYLLAQIPSLEKYQKASCNHYRIVRNMSASNTGSDYRYQL